VIGNDVLHIDNLENQTTRGTPQDTDGLWHENFKEARKMYVSIIERLMQIAPVHVVFNPSNHDYMSGYFLADTLECWFNKSKDVTFDISIKHRKFMTFGDNLIMTSHGDEAKESDYAYLMPNEEPEMWAKTKFRYVYLHHIHHKKVIKYKSGSDFNGVTIEYLRSPSAADAWHYRNGYCVAPKAVEAFIHSPTEGQIARITVKV
jgi:DNA repair exonuclease SbcCD nuclease subunit